MLGSFNLNDFVDVDSQVLTSEVFVELDHTEGASVECDDVRDSGEESDSEPALAPPLKEELMTAVRVFEQFISTHQVPMELVSSFDKLSECAMKAYTSKPRQAKISQFFQRNL